MKYFAYGSNLNSQRLKDRGLTFLVEERLVGTLYDYDMRFNKISKYYPGFGGATINAQPGSKTEGILYTIADGDIERLDQFEGYPEHYSRIEVPIHLANKEIVTAITYIVVPEKIQEGLLPHPEYLDHILLGARGMLSREYVASLEKYLLPRGRERRKEKF